jgi:hypothetical protein
LDNGGFETQTGPELGVPNSINVYYVKNGSMPSWSSNAPSGDIEVWADIAKPPQPRYEFKSISGEQALKAGDLFFPQGGGKYFIELNARSPDTLTQIATLKRSGLLSYSLWHQGRFGVDSIGFNILKQQNGQWVPVRSEVFSTGSPPNSGWTNYTGKNLFLGQIGEVYKVEVTALSTTLVDASGNTVLFPEQKGNLIDNVAFGFIVAPNPEVPPEIPPEILPELPVSAVTPRNTDAAPAGAQRYYYNLGETVLNFHEWPQQIPLCDDLNLSSRPETFKAATAETPEPQPSPHCSCKNYQSSRGLFTFAADSREYYGFRTGVRTWATGFYSSLNNVHNSSLGERSNRADVSGAGGLLGLETSITSTTQVGIYGSAGGMKIDQIGNGGGDWSPSAYGFGLYGRWSPGPYFLAAQAGYGWLSGDQTRGIELDNETLQASGYKSGEVFNTSLAGGVRVRLSRDTLLTPSAIVGWASVYEDPFTESGAGVFNAQDLFNLNYASHRTSWTSLDLGATLSRIMRSGTTLIIPSLRLAYFGNWKTGGGDQEVDYSFSSDNVSMPGGWLDRNGIRVALGVDVTTHRNTSMFLRGTADFPLSGGGGATGYGVNGGLLYRFGGVHAKRTEAETCPVVAAPILPPEPVPVPPAPVRGLW